MPDYGKIAWEAYAEAVGGTTFDDKPLPKWEDLGQRQKDGWGAAASAVLNAAPETPDEAA